MRILLHAVVLVLALLHLPGAAAATADDFAYGNTKADGSGLPFRYFIPPNYDPAQAYPVVLFLHGAGERGSDNERQLRNHANGAMYLLDDANLAEQPVIMIAPQCPGGGWWSGGNLSAAIGIIEQLAADYHVDPERLYVTGLSMGGMGTWSAVLARPGLFAAAVPMSGNGATAQAIKVAQLPFWFFHAANDGTVSVGGSDALVAALRDVGARVIYTRYDSGGHAIWSRAYRTPLLFHWLVSQRRGRADESVAPGVHVMSPLEGPSLFTGAPAIELAGVAGNGGEAIDSVGWNLRGGATGTATGTTSWATGSIALDPGHNLLRVIATGPSYYAPYGGHTTFNDSLRVTRAEGVVFADGFGAY